MASLHVRLHYHGDDDDGGGGGSGELLDKAQFEVRDAQEAAGHDDQCDMVLPEAPGGVIHTLLLQKRLPLCAAADTEVPQSPGDQSDHRLSDT